MQACNVYGMSFPIAVEKRLKRTGVYNVTIFPPLN